MTYTFSFRPLAAVALTVLIAVVAIAPVVRAQNPTSRQNTAEDEMGNAIEKTIDNIGKALASPSQARHVAALSLAPTLKLTPAMSGTLIKKLIEFQPKVQGESEEVQIAWLTAYGRLHLKPEDNTTDLTWKENYDKFPAATDSAKRLDPFVASGSSRVRAAASESLCYLFIAAVQRLEKPSVTPSSINRDLEPDQRIAAGLAMSPVVTFYPWLDLFFSGEIDNFSKTIEPYLPLLTTVLKSSDPAALKWGLDALRNLATSIADNLPDPRVRREKELAVDPYQAKIKLLLFGPTVKKLDSLTPSVEPVLKSNDPEVRMLAHKTAEAIANARRLARTTLHYEPSPGNTLLPVSKDDYLLPGLKTLLPTLYANLKAGDPALRLSAMEALENFETAIWSDRGQIIAATRDPSPFLRWVAARALGKMIPKKPENNEQADALNALVQLLPDTDIDVRLSALSALLKWGEFGSAAAEPVIVFISRGDVDSRLAAIATLEAIKPDPSRETQVMVSALSQEDFRVRRAAAAVLGRLGPKAKEAVPALEKVLTDADPELRRIAGEAILAIE